MKNNGAEREKSETAVTDRSNGGSTMAEANEKVLGREDFFKPVNPVGVSGQARSLHTLLYNIFTNTEGKFTQVSDPELDRDGNFLSLAIPYSSLRGCSLHHHVLSIVIKELKARNVRLVKMEKEINNVKENCLVLSPITE